jgi:putative ABC transport system substrate-binding protein
VKRREFIGIVGGTALWSVAARGQHVQKVPRIGFLGNSTAALEANLVGPFREGLRELGYEEGHNLQVVYQWAEGRYERLPTLIKELLAENVEVIVTAGTPASLAVKNAAPSIPLVMVAVGEPIATGLVASLARPGGNVTGLTSISPEMQGKRLELLKEVVPKLTHIAVLWNSSSSGQSIQESETRAAAQVLGLTFLSMGVRSKQEIENAFQKMMEKRPDALLVMPDRIFLHHRELIMHFAAQHRLPGVYSYREFVEIGGLMSYGPSYSDMHKRAATYVDKILKGVKPAALPVERPVKFELVINLKSARALGLEIPPTLLSRADEVIE